MLCNLVTVRVTLILRIKVSIRNVQRTMVIQKYLQRKCYGVLFMINFNNIPKYGIFKNKFRPFHAFFANALVFSSTQLRSTQVKFLIGKLILMNLNCITLHWEFVEQVLNFQHTTKLYGFWFVHSKVISIIAIKWVWNSSPLYCTSHIVCFNMFINELQNSLDFS